MQTTTTACSSPQYKTRFPWLFLALVAVMLISLWGVGYGESIPFVIPFFMIIAGPLMHMLTYELPNRADKPAAAQGKDNHAHMGLPHTTH